MTDPATLRALAARAETEAPSTELQEAIAEALGWMQTGTPNHRWLTPLGNPVYWPDPWLTSADAALARMPKGWHFSVETPLSQKEWFALAGRTGGYEEGAAPTLPQAVTALALRCRAADLEAKR